MSGNDSEASDLEDNEGVPDLRFKRSSSLTGESKLKAKELEEVRRAQDELPEGFHAQACSWLRGHILSWQKLEAEEIEVKVLRGGLTNLLFTCKAVGENAHTVTPRKVLLRIYGDGTDLFFSRVLGEICFVLLSESGFGPKLYGVWGEGRLEEWLELRTLAPEEMKYPAVSTSISHQVAQLHTMHMPFDKTPVILFNCRQWLAKSEFIAQKYVPGVVLSDENILSAGDTMALVKHNFNEQEQDWLKEFFGYGLREEYNWLLNEILSNVRTPIVFAHNDLQAGNIMCNEQDEVKLIDFEYGNYNFLCYDLANHFAEWLFDYQGVEEWPYYSVSMDQWPDLDTQRTFVTEYLAERHRILKKPQLASLQKIKRYLKDINRLVLASHFQWSTWSVIQASMSKIDFPYLEFGLRRFEVYLKMKKALPETLKAIDALQ